MRAALGSEEALGEEFRESIVVVMGNSSFGGQINLALRFVVFEGMLLQQRRWLLDFPGPSLAPSLGLEDLTFP